MRAAKDPVGEGTKSPFELLMVGSGAPSGVERLLFLLGFSHFFCTLSVQPFQHLSACPACVSHLQPK